jgi:hypothetical protein
MARETPTTVVVAELVAVGLKYEIEQGKHVKIRFFALGRRYTYTVPNTPGDHRSMLNCRAGIRRLIRELGLQK